MPQAIQCVLLHVCRPLGWASRCRPRHILSSLNELFKLARQMFTSLVSSDKLEFGLNFSLLELKSSPYRIEFELFDEHELN